MPDMSISRWTGYLSLSAFLLFAAAACGDDDAGTDDGGGQADAGNGGGEADAGEADAAGEPDAAEADAAPPIKGPQYLLGLSLLVEDSPLGDINGVARVVATVAPEGTTADFSLQAVFAPSCDDQGGNGLPAGNPTVVTDVEIGADGSFEIVLDDAVFPGGTVDVPKICGLGDITADLTVTGSIQATGEPCGTVTGLTGPPLADLNVTGTFGGVSIEQGTIGEDLPEPQLACPVK